MNFIFLLPDNNVNVMAFAYKWLRYNGDCRDFLFVSIRTGVRIVPVINNHLILSRGGLSGELGHVKVALMAPCVPAAGSAVSTLKFPTSAYWESLRRVLSSAVFQKLWKWPEETRTR